MQSMGDVVATGLFALTGAFGVEMLRQVLSRRAAQTADNAVIRVAQITDEASYRTQLREDITALKQELADTYRTANTLRNQLFMQQQQNYEMEAQLHAKEARIVELEAQIAKLKAVHHAKQ